MKRSVEERTLTMDIRIEVERAQRRAGAEQLGYGADVLTMEWEELNCEPPGSPP